MQHDRALELAKRFRAEIAPACVKTAIAGGLRRQKPDVHDIEIVAFPKYDANLLGEAEEIYSALDAILTRGLASGLLAWDTKVKRNGPRAKRFVLPQADNLPLDLFLTQEDNWGVKLAIWTGCAAFSQAFVTPQSRGGLLPNTLVVQDGWLWEYPSYKEANAAREADKPLKSARRVPCSTEPAFFNALRLPTLPPRERGDPLWEQIRGMPFQPVAPVHVRGSRNMTPETAGALQRVAEGLFEVAMDGELP